MPPTGYRTAQRSALRSRRLRGIDHASERLYWRLLLAVDPYGTTHADEALVQAEAVAGVTAYGPGDVAHALDQLEAAGLIVRWQEDGEWYLHLANFEKHQNREFMRKRGAPQMPAVPADLLEGRPNAGAGTAPEPKPKPEPLGTDVPLSASADDEDGDDGVEPVSSTGHVGCPHVVGPVPCASCAGPSPARQVFEHWRSVEVDTGGIGATGRTPTFTGDRRAKVVARLKEGFTVEQLCQAVDGFARDPFHLGVNDQRRRYTDLTTTMKGGAKVDAGIRLTTAALAATNGKGRFAEYD